jgi:hypothetical protein
MARKKRPDAQPDLFGQQPTPRPPRRGTFAHALARADARPTPLEAEGLPPGLQRLARLCKTLAEDAGGEPFTLGTGRAGEVVGGDGLAGSAALHALQDAGLIALVERGRPGQGCSRWEWVADRRSPVRPFLRLFSPEAAGSAAWN